MFHTGLVSISFRGNTAEELIQAAKETGITAIEWGSDVHVPAGDVQRAAQVKALCLPILMHLMVYAHVP